MPRSKRVKKTPKRTSKRGKRSKQAKGSSKVKCFCGAPMRLRDSRYGQFWGCSDYPKCDGIIGAHPDGSPVGTPADKETREARQRAHAAFDDWWRSEGMERVEAYEWLEENGPKAHIADMDYDECEELVEMMEEMESTSGD